CCTGRATRAGRHAGAVRGQTDGRADRVSRGFSHSHVRGTCRLLVSGCSVHRGAMRARKPSAPCACCRKRPALASLAAPVEGGIDEPWSPTNSGEIVVDHGAQYRQAPDRRERVLRNSSAVGPVLAPLTDTSSRKWRTSSQTQARSSTTCGMIFSKQFGASKPASTACLPSKVAGITWPHSVQLPKPVESGMRRNSYLTIGSLTCSGSGRRRAARRGRYASVVMHSVWNLSGYWRE